MAEYLSPVGRGEWYMDKSTGDMVLVVANTVVARVTSASALTATSFVGDITGDVTGDVTGAVTGDVTGSLDQAATIVFADDAAATARTISVDNQATATKAGNALQLTAGLGNTTGAGGALALTAGAGGNDAVGGAASLTAGAAGGGNRAGGDASLVSGAGAGSAAGGAIAVTSGAGGATGNSGAITVSAGAVTATGGGDSGAITITTPAGATHATAGGAGGTIAVTGGAGGATSGAGGTGGNGTSVTITAGAGGADGEGASGTGGDGGSITLTPGAGGAGNTAGSAGNVVVAGGRGITSNVSNGYVPMIIAAVSQAITTDAQAVSVANYLTTLDASGANTQCTMASGSVVGQLKKITVVGAPGGNTCDVDYTATGGAATITYNNVGESTLFMWNGSAWVVLSNYNEATGSATGGVTS